MYLASVAYQGLSAIFLSFPSAAAQDQALLGIAPEFVDDAALLTSAAMGVFAVRYLLSQPQRLCQPRLTAVALSAGSGPPGAVSAAEGERQYTQPGGRMPRPQEFRILLSATMSGLPPILGIAGERGKSFAGWREYRQYRPPPAASIQK